MTTNRLALIVGTALSAALVATGQGSATSPETPLPRTADGKPDLQGIWQASTTAGADLQDHIASLNALAMPSFRSCVDNSLFGTMRES